MNNRLLKYSIALCCALTFFAGRTMEEGMWLLDAVHKLPLPEMKSHGLELTPEQIYSSTGPSLKDAIVLLPGGTGAYVSNEGLILTNHHIAFAGIRSLSSVEDDYLRDGFWAKSRKEELTTSYTAQTVVAMKDVTEEVLSAVSDTMSADERSKAITARSREIEKAAKEDTDYNSTVSEMFSGVKYYLFTYDHLDDVRLVYAPPSSIGNFGGEVDNWTWPRHTGDFAFMRAYVGPDGKPAKYSKDNIPYKPKVFLPFSAQGVKEGSFAMIMGFPGRTYRYREAASVQLAHDQTLPTLIDFYEARIDIIERAAKKDRAVEIKYATTLRRMANAYKNYIGTLEGMRRADLLNVKRAEESRFAAHLSSTPELAARFETILSELEKANAELRTFNLKNLLFTNITGGLQVLTVANRFLAYLRSFPKDSAGNTLDPTDKERAPVRQVMASTYKDFDLNVEKETLVALVLKSADLPPDQQSTTFRDIMGSTKGLARERKVREFVEDLFDETLLATQAGAEKLLMQDPDDILDDEYIQFAQKLGAEQSELSVKSARFTTTIGGLRETFLRTWLDWKHKDVAYPDANRTLRLTFGEVEPLHPRDAVRLSYATSLEGIVEKETGEDPFIVPARLKDLWKSRDFGRYADPQRGDVPVAFIANLDITGGNSGSPVINGKGEVIGCAFDGNWEAVVGDYYFQDRYNRSINVDARYILFLLDKFSGAENILNELVIR